MPELWLVDGSQRLMLPLRDVWEYERMFVRGRHAKATVHAIKCFDEYTKI